MALSVPVKLILRKLSENKNLMRNYLGDAKPHLVQLDDETWPLCYKFSFREEYFSFLFSNILGNVEMNTDIFVNILSNSRTFIHFCRLLSYLVHETWIPENGQSEGLKLCTIIIVDVIEFVVRTKLGISKKTLQKYIANTLPPKQMMSLKNAKHEEINSHLLDMYLNVCQKENLTKIHNMLSPFHKRHTCPLMKTRYTVLHKPLTYLKHKLGEIENEIVTKRVARGSHPESIHDEVKPPLNFVYGASVLELGIIAGGKISTNDIFSTVRKIKEIPRDVDSVALVSSLTDMARNRLHVKFLEVNEQYCTCHTKCLGYDLNSVLKEEVSNKGLTRNTTITICQKCRLTPVVRNTRARKPRMSLSESNPKHQTCSLDHSCALEDINLYTCEYKGFGVFRFQHLFYTTNATNAMDEVSEKDPSGPSGNLYGMCFGGSRTCLNRFWCNMPSSRYTYKAMYGNKERYMCRKCIDKGIFSNTFSQCVSFLYGKNVFDKTTCIDLCLDELEKTKSFSHTINKICNGCKLKFLCSHTPSLSLQAIITLSNWNDNLRMVKRTIYRTHLVNEIRRYLLSHG